MTRTCLAFFAVFLFAASIVSGSDFRTFRDSQGREMKAKLTRVSGEDVYIERSDGLTTKVALPIFSKEDQKYIHDWAKTELLKSGIFEVRFTTDVTDKEKSESGGIKKEAYRSSYGIVLTNTSYENISNIRIEYLVIKFQDAIAAQKRSEGETKRLKGEAKIAKIDARSEAEVRTESIPMLETKLAPNYSWVGGGKKTSKDELKGIWVKIYVGDMLVQEYSRPETMMRNEVW